MKKKNCLFCAREFGVNAKKAKEHIFPLWLQKALGVKGTSIHATHFHLFDKKDRAFFKPKRGDLDFKKVSQRKHVFAGMVYGLICKKCNSGFLNDIETEAQSVLLKLILDKKIVLGKKEQEVISKWGYKTALILNKASNFEKYFSKDAYHSFFITKLPESNIRISIAKLNKRARKGDFWIQTRSVFFEVPRLSDFYLSTIKDKHSGITKKLAVVPKQAKIVQMIGQNSFSIALNLNGLLIKVSYIPIGKYPIEVHENKPGVFRIWPLIEGLEINWPPKNRFWDLSEFVLNSRIKLLSG